MYLEEQHLVSLKQMLNASGLLDNAGPDGYVGDWDSALQRGFDQALRLYDPSHAEVMAGKQPATVEQLGYAIRAAMQEGVTLAEVFAADNKVELEAPAAVELTEEELAAAEARKQELADAAAQQESERLQAEAAAQKLKDEQEAAAKEQAEKEALEAQERTRQAAADAGTPAPEGTSEQSTEEGDEDGDDESGEESAD